MVDVSWQFLHRKHLLANWKPLFIRLSRVRMRSFMAFQAKKAAGFLWEGAGFSRWALWGIWRFLGAEELQKKSYSERTLKISFFVWFQLSLSSPLFGRWEAMVWSNFSYSSISQSCKYLVTSMFQVLPSSEACLTVIYLSLEMAKMRGKLFCNTVVPHQRSFQNLILEPFPIFQVEQWRTRWLCFQMLFHRLKP